MSKKVEPIIEAEFEVCGYPCVVLFQPYGWRCGYVGVPKGHPCYEKSYDEMEEIKCHGGLTYAAGALAGQEQTDLWWFGFDCNHYGDKIDTVSFDEYYSDDTQRIQVLAILALAGGTVRSLEFVKKQCAKIAEQLKALDKKQRPPRLTFDGNFCDISMCRENPCPYGGDCSQKQVWERLKEYEDTGLTPEEIKNAKKKRKADGENDRQ